jgi:hypothetical protein
MGSMRVWIVVVALGLAGCSSFQVERLRVGMSATEVRERAGAPSEERVRADGGRTWYYAGGFTGWQTWRVAFDPKGLAIAVEPLLSVENIRSSILPRRSRRDDVTAALGAPGQIQNYPGRREEVYSYRFRDGTLETIADVHMDQSTGYVTSVDIYRDPVYFSGGPD